MTRLLSILFAATVGSLLYAGPAIAVEPAPSNSAETLVEQAVTCHPDYVQCLPIKDDIDCSDDVITEPINLKVPGVDPYDLDNDQDGIGCESKFPDTSPSPNPTTKPPVTKKPASPKPSPTKTVVAAPDGPELPRTGSNMPLFVGSGVVILVAGSLLMFAFRTRKVRVEVPKDER